jgi:hypothetical protein
MVSSSSWLSSSLTDATSPTAQGWVDGLQSVSRETDYAEWSAAAGLSALQAAMTADPDQDGASNYQEYLFSTAPLNPASSPPRLEIQPSMVMLESGQGWEQNGVALLIPYLPAGTSGFVESSPDLKHWVKEPFEMARFPMGMPPFSILGPVSSTPTHNAVGIIPSTPARYYRLKLD